MKFDPALKAAVHDRAPDGATFDRAEVEQALRWAYDVRATGRSRLDPWYRDTPVGQAAAAAVDAYRPPSPQPAGPGTIAHRLVVFALAALIPLLMVVLLISVVLRLAGVNADLITGRGLLVGFVCCLAVGWIIRDRIHLAEPRYNRYAVPAQRRGETDPIATTMTDPDLQQRDQARGETGSTAR